MRHITLAMGLAVALPAMLAMAPAKADMSGQLEQNGMCRQYGNVENPNHEFSYWDKCPSFEGRNTTSGRRVIKVTNGGVGSGIGRTHVATHRGPAG